MHLLGNNITVIEKRVNKKKTLLKCYGGHKLVGAFQKYLQPALPRAQQARYGAQKLWWDR